MLVASVSSQSPPPFLTHQIAFAAQRQGNLADVYKAFLHCVSLLGEHGSAGGRLEDLVSALLKFRFQQHSELVVTSFTQLLWFVQESQPLIFLASEFFSCSTLHITLKFPPHTHAPCYFLMTCVAATWCQRTTLF